MTTPANELKAVIPDVFATDEDEEDEIRVDHPLGSCGFPCESSSERRDQARNAREFAQKMVDEGKCSGIDDLVDQDPTLVQRGQRDAG